MEILSPAARIDAGPQHSGAWAGAELARLRAQVARLKAERTALRWALGHDELTGLPNRRLLYTLAPALLRDTERSAVVIMLDLDGFKPINDRFGHDTGDRVLRIVAQRIASCADDNLAARLGGDEFAAVLTRPRPERHDGWWQRWVANLAAAIAEPMPVGGHTLTVTASIGVAPVHGDAAIDELLHRADLAMYQAKVTGRSRVACHTDAVNGTSHPCGGRSPLSRRDQPRETISTSDLGAGTGIASAGQDHDPRHGLRVIELALFPAAQHDDGRVSVPTCDPIRRDPADVAPASTYHRDDPIWVHRHGAWRPGVVEEASAKAVMATYRCAAGRGTVVDTMSAEFVLPRSDAELAPTT